MLNCCDHFVTFYVLRMTSNLTQLIVIRVFVFSCSCVICLFVRACFFVFFFAFFYWFVGARVVHYLFVVFCESDARVVSLSCGVGICVAVENRNP